jgi:hypothetical protein
MLAAARMVGSALFPFDEMREEQWDLPKAIPLSNCKELLFRRVDYYRDIVAKALTDYRTEGFVAAFPRETVGFL